MARVYSIYREFCLLCSTHYWNGILPRAIPRRCPHCQKLDHLSPEERKDYETFSLIVRKLTNHGRTLIYSTMAIIKSPLNDGLPVFTFQADPAQPEVGVMNVTGETLEAFGFEMDKEVLQGEQRGVGAFRVVVWRKLSES